MRENADQKISGYGHFSRSAYDFFQRETEQSQSNFGLCDKIEDVINDKIAPGNYTKV